MNLGAIYQERGDFDNALRCPKVFDLNPDNSDALVNLGTIYYELGDLDQAIASPFNP